MDDEDELLFGKLSCRPKGNLRGIANLGNTCYINCILQVLAHTPILNDVEKLGEHSIDPSKKKKLRSSTRRESESSVLTSTTEGGGMLESFKEVMKEVS